MTSFENTISISSKELKLVGISKKYLTKELSMTECQLTVNQVELGVTILDTLPCVCLFCHLVENIHVPLKITNITVTIILMRKAIFVDF